MRLSICIPTYNRADYLPETLESIVRQASDQVEIVISDNASTDATEMVVAAYQKRFARLTYFRWPENMGADRNYLKVIELAHGEYCWFMGSDDIVEPGGIAAVLQAIERYGPLAGISVNGNAYKMDFANRFADRLVARRDLVATRLLQTVGEIFSAVGEYFGYLPGQVVNRSLWQQTIAAHDPTPFFNAYVHVYVIGRMVQTMPRWLYLDDRCVGWRGGNDSFLAAGRFRRFEIIVAGFRDIARALFGEGTVTYDQITKSILSHHVFTALCLAKRDAVPVAFFRQAWTLCAATYWRYSLFWIKIVPVFLTPRWLFMMARYWYRKTGV